MLDIKLGETIDIKFTTCEPDTGAPATLSGTPVISAYVDNSTTQITAGITLTVDFDGVTGLNNVRVVATSGNGYTTGTNVALIITTGTVDAVSAVGYKVGEFTIGRQASLALRPTTADRTLDVTAGGEAGIDIANISALPAGAIPALGIAENGTMQAGSTGTTAVLRAATSFGDDNPIGYQIWITGGTGVGQTRFITDWVSATDTATVATWTVTPDNTSTYIVFPSASSTADSNIAAIKAVTDLLPDAGALTSLATQTSVNTIDDFLDTEIAAIKAKTDSLTFTVAGVLDANIQRINDVAITGNGQTGTEFSV